jgi:ubiquinone/menaquinone biosynthesis C-methylase UbiE
MKGPKEPILQSKDEHMKKEYNFTAKIYDPMLFLAINRIRKAVMKELIDHKESRILDLCCGTGNQLKMLSKNGFKTLHCLDLSEPMLEIARKGDHSIDIHKQDAAKTGFNDREFDIVMLSFALHEKDRQTQLDILEEVDRILRDNGLLLIVDFAFDKKTRMLGRFGADLIERMAGGEHYRNFNRYKQSGGLPAIIDKNKLRSEKSLRRIFNVVTISTYNKMKIS